VCSLWLALVIVVALVASYGRHVLEHNAQQQTITLNRLGRLAEANALLFQLNKIAQTLPSSLDMGEVLDSTIAKLRDLIHFDAITVLLLDESDRMWVPVRELGNPGQQPLPTNALPAVLQRSLAGSGASMENSLDPNLFSGPGLWPDARSGIYAALSARGSQIGLLALESKAMANFAPTDIEVLNGITDSFAYAVSNARLFARLRTIGAEEERTRIARDLHDQIGQALAHLGFELDRAKRANARGEDMTPRLEELRGEVGGVTRMVRDTLYDLRTDVTESQDVRQTMELFVSRVQERSGLEVTIDVNATGRMPLIQEREMWRIAKEAVVNVERHAKAKSLNIRWTSDGKSAELVVADDGVGYDKNKARDDSYGIMGMKERAASIGAHLELESNPGSGTTIRVALANSPQ
jgi:signal transduction histidine kinase